MIARTIGYYDDSKRRGGTTRYLVELLGALNRERFQPVFFAPQGRDWHADLRALDVEVITISAGIEDDTPAIPSSLSPVGMPSAQKRLFQVPVGFAWSAGMALELCQLVRLFRRRPVD